MLPVGRRLKGYRTMGSEAKRQSILTRYTDWLHGRWPHGGVEKLPIVGEDFSTNVAGIYVVGDLTGIPLLKFALDSGAKAARTVAEKTKVPDAAYDLAIVGGGVAGIAAAVEARRQKLRFVVIETAELFSTIANFPKQKPIFTYPTTMQPEGELEVSATIKEDLLAELQAQAKQHEISWRRGKANAIVRQGKFLKVVFDGEEDPVLAANVIVAIGRSGNFRKLNVPGEDNHHRVFNRLHDPKEASGKDVLVVGGGDSAIETAIATAKAGARVTLSYRKSSLTRPKPENIDRLNTAVATEKGDNAQGGSLALCLGTQVENIGANTVSLADKDGAKEILQNDLVYTMIGREPPLDFFRRSGVRIAGEWRLQTWVGLAGVLLACIFVYHWKSDGTFLFSLFKDRSWFPFQLDGADPSTLWGAFRNAWKDPSFYYSSAYCAVIVIFGIKRIRRRQTPYITAQTFTLMAIQVIPLFLLPYLLLPWLGANGVFETGFGKTVGDALFPGDSYWRAFGLILAWPLFLWNVFTEQPLWAWLTISLAQTFVVIPWIVYRWGKGAYCGWICSCGALAETLGDTQRHKMPHGPVWNRVNMLGQAILAVALVLFVLRIISWATAGTTIGNGIAGVYTSALSEGVLSYKYLVDLWLAGILGVGMYFHFSGRVWCRFACPLAALMHIYARFSRFRIFAEKSKCISCNVCTSVCHQGIDVMSFANKGEPMADPQCVRCSACVQSCPTGTLEFGQIEPKTQLVLYRSHLPASRVRQAETTAKPTL